MKEEDTTSALADADAQYRAILALMTHLLASGLSRAALKKTTMRALAALRDPRIASQKKPSRRPTVSEKISRAFQRWRLFRRFIDAHGNPKALPLHGPAPSVESLIRQEGLGDSTRTVIKEIIKLKLIKRLRSGRYVPTGRHVIIGGHHPYVYEDHARSIVRLLQTAHFNAVARKDSLKFIERSAHVGRLPRAKLQAFRDFTNQQGAALVDTVNEWLESHNLPRGRLRGKRRDTEAGIHLYAFAGTQQ